MKQAEHYVMYFQRSSAKRKIFEYIKALITALLKEQEHLEVFL